MTPTVPGDRAMLGVKLDPDAARGHPWITDFWVLTDWLFLNDPVAHENLYHFGRDAST